MNPTGRLKFNSRPFVLGALALLSALGAFTLARAADDPVPRPPELERDVQFWIRIYTEFDTNSGVLHDQYNLGVVYKALHFAPDTPPRERQREVENAREAVTAALRRIADSGDAPLSPEDQQIKDLWGAEATPARLRAATEDIRFQLGQSDRFRAGLIRSGAWETHIAETLANLGLPPELAVLPHVESSFNPSAYSKVGAAGLWQFMRSTGRRYMRIDSAVDDRLDPFRSTEAAAQLLAYNYRLLGSWPLALTAYNHGTAGMLRAKEAMGTDDIVRIVRGYTGRTFGFASRNYYVSFLAALEIDRHPEKYFGAVHKDSEARFREVPLPAYVSVSALARTLRIDSAVLHGLNPALLPPVWSGQQRVPRDYRLRLPLDGEAWTSALLAQRLSPGEMFPGQRGPRRYKTQKGDTLVSVAAQFDVPVEVLARSNHIRTSAHLSPGHLLTLPEPPAQTLGAAAQGAAVSGRRRAALPGRRRHARSRGARERRGCRGRPGGRGCDAPPALQHHGRGALGGRGRGAQSLRGPRRGCRAECRPDRLHGRQGQQYPRRRRRDPRAPGRVAGPELAAPARPQPLQRQTSDEDR